MAALLGWVVGATGACGGSPGANANGHDAATQADGGSHDVDDGTDAPTLGPWSGSWSQMGLPAGVEGWFGGGRSDRHPRIVYPLAGSMHPSNLADITFQWTSEGFRYFRLTFANDRGSADFFASCDQEECSLPAPADLWKVITNANADAGVTLELFGVEQDGGEVGASDPIALAFSPAPVRGGLYYWSTGLRGIYRLRFGARRATPYIEPNSVRNGKDCGGCHSVSRNGKRIAFTAGAAEGFLSVAPAEAPEAQLITPGAFENCSVTALSPGGDWALVSFASELRLYEPSSGRLVTTVKPILLDPMGVGLAGYFPDWSPDGDTIALVLASKRNGADSGGLAKSLHGVDFDLGDGSIALLPFEGGSFGPARVLVPQDKDFHFYPTWSPDAQWIAFASAPVGMGGGGSDYGEMDSSYNTPNARLRMVRVGDGKVVELANATQGVGNTSTWPRFTPFSQADDQVFFLTFNSHMDYGFVTKDVKRPQLWLSAIDLRRLDDGDPSFAPVWLPFQRPEEANHLAAWTEAVACRGSTSQGDPGGCGPEEVCRNGFCEQE